MLEKGSVCRDHLFSSLTYLNSSEKQIQGLALGLLNSSRCGWGPAMCCNKPPRQSWCLLPWTGPQHGCSSEHALCSQVTWIWIPFFKSLVKSLRKITLGKWLNFSVPQFPHLKDRARNDIFHVYWNYKLVNICEALRTVYMVSTPSVFCYSSSRIVALSYLMLLESASPSRAGNMYLTSNKYHIHLCIHSSNIIENLLRLRGGFMFCTF